MPEDQNIILEMLESAGISGDEAKNKYHQLTVSSYVNMFSVIKDNLPSQDKAKFQQTIDSYYKTQNPYDVESLAKLITDATNSAEGIKEKLTEAKLHAFQDFWKKLNLTETQKTTLTQMYSAYLDIQSPEVKNAKKTFEEKFGNLI